MASDIGPVATEAPILASSLAQGTGLSENQETKDASRSRSLKRRRDATPSSPNSQPVSPKPDNTSVPVKYARSAILASRRSPVPQTAAAAIDDERRREEEEKRTPNTAVGETSALQAVSALMSSDAAQMSRPQDAPANPAENVTNTPTSLSAKEPDAEPAAPSNDAPVPDANVPAQLETPVSAISPAGGGTTVTTASPVPMEVDAQAPTVPAPADADAEAKKAASGSLLYAPVQPAPEGVHAPTARQMTIPPSTKKHRCQYCDTEFTRHHNLKSHLLTHSQEKPYVCQACQMRFRRLHDLKRHSKLHTGEKPHICPKCDRKFARGDALARHTKGPGGCAGRRSSMGSMGEGGDDFETTETAEGDDTMMSGVAYEGGDTEMTEEERRRSLPSIKAQHISGASPPPHGEAFNHHSRTYPPAGQRSAGGLYPPNVDRVAPSTTTTTTTSPSVPNSTASGHTPNTSISSAAPMSAGGSSMYSQSGMTESPKPLSPGAAQANQPGHDGSSSIARQRSPSHTSQFQQQHFGHRQSDRHTPPGLSLPSPLASAKLPGVSGFAAPPYPAQSAMAAAALAGAGHSTRAQQQQQPHSAGSDGPYSNTMAYIQSLEAKVEAHAAKIHELEAQVAKIHELEEVVASLVQSKADANAFQKKTEAQAEAVVAATQA